MITQVFKYRKLYINIAGTTYSINVPFYGNNTYLAMDPDGRLHTYDVKPVFNTEKQYYEVSPENTYDLVAQYEGNTSNLYTNIIEIVDKQDEYTFTEH